MGEKIVYVTRTQREADKLRAEGKLAWPIFASLTGARFDKIEVTFDIADPIPYQEEETDVGRKKAHEIRQMERTALLEYWPTLLFPNMAENAHIVDDDDPHVAFYRLGTRWMAIVKSGAHRVRGYGATPHEAIAFLTKVPVGTSDAIDRARGLIEDLMDELEPRIDWED